MTHPLADEFHQEVLDRLRVLGEPKRAAAAANDKKSQLQFLAIRVPVVRAAVKSGFSFYDRPADEILSIWDSIWFSSPYFEVMDAALHYYGLQGRRISSEIWPVVVGWASRVEN
jgi:hypothetical protein